MITIITKPRTVKLDDGYDTKMYSADGMPICGRHLREIDEVAVELCDLDVHEGLECQLHGTCAMCDVAVQLSSGQVEEDQQMEKTGVGSASMLGRVCYRDECGKRLHEHWPAVYCSNRCALIDL